MQRVTRAGDKLFLTGGSNDVLRLYDDADLLPIEDWRSRIAAREAFFAGLGVKWCMLLVPEKLSVLGDSLLPAGSVPPAQRLLDVVPHPNLVNPTEALRRLSPAGYARTDSHWLPEGAACAFAQVMATLGLDFDAAAPAQLALREVSFHGDLWDTSHEDLPQDRFARRALPDSVQRVHANRIVTFKETHGLENETGLHTGSHVVWRNDAAPHAARVVLFGSSFSEYRAECSLLSFLAAITFAEVHFVWSADLDRGLIARIAPDIAILEMPERFLTHCPRDDFDLPAHEDAVLARYDGLAGASSSPSSSSSSSSSC
jgi:alginate O-acetyltransferase complex protein AlgJ